MDRIKVRNKFKPKDNYDVNRAKVKREQFKGKEKMEMIKKKDMHKEPVEQQELPKQVITKFISMEGSELSDNQTNELTLPTEITIADLNKLMNEKLLKDTEVQVYQFYINDIQIKLSLKETLEKIKDFSSEQVCKIVYCPESLFRVKPLTRGGTILEGHTDSILTIQFSPDGNLLCSGSGDSSMRFWDLMTDTPYQVEPAHNVWVLCLSFSPCGDFLVSGDVEGYFVVWNINTRKPLGPKIKAHAKWITSVSWKPLHLYKDDQEPELFVTTGKDGFLKIWFARTMKINISVKAHEQSITKTIWSGDNYIYTASQDQLIKIFDEKLVLLKVLTGHAHWINALAINTESILRIGCFDYSKCKNDSFYEKSSEIRLLPKKDKISLALNTYTTFKAKINSSEKIVSGSDDFTLILWDGLKSDKPILRMTGHQGIINDVKFSPNAFYLASGSFDKCLKIWNANSGAFLFNLRGHVGPIYQISWSPNSKMILSGSKDSTLMCWNIDTRKMMHDLPGHADEIYCVDWNPNGVKAASGSKDRMVRIWVN